MTERELDENGNPKLTAEELEPTPKSDPRRPHHRPMEGNAFEHAERRIAEGQAAAAAEAAEPADAEPADDDQDDAQQ